MTAQCLVFPLFSCAFFPSDISAFRAGLGRRETGSKASAFDHVCFDFASPLAFPFTSNKVLFSDTLS